MLTLAIETSSSIGSVALLRDDECLAESSFGARERHSADPSTHPDGGGRGVLRAGLVPAVQKILAKASVRADAVDLWAVGLGPGSFMGIRVGIAAAKGFSLATDKPVVGVASFHAIAAEHFAAVAAGADRGSPRTLRQDHAPLPRAATVVAVTVDAGHGEIYLAEYDRTRPILDTPIRLIPAKDVPRTAVVGPASGEHAKARHVAVLARAKFLQKQSGDEILEPIYLRQTKFKKHEGHE